MHTMLAAVLQALDKLELDASFGTTPLAMYRAIRLLETGLIDIEGVISHRFPLRQIHQAVGSDGQPKSQQSNHQSMKAIVNTALNQLEWQDISLPQPAGGQVRVRTAACGICATDLQMIAGWTRTGFPSISGHEWAGIVDAVGAGVDAGLIGQHCVAENVLADGGEVGFEHPGGYAEGIELTRSRRGEVVKVIVEWTGALGG